MTGSGCTGIPFTFWKRSWIPERFRGTCYRAANWVLLGPDDRDAASNPTDYVPNRSLKQVLGYPLTPRFREYLTQL